MNIILLFYTILDIFMKYMGSLCVVLLYIYIMDSDNISIFIIFLRDVNGII